MSAVLLVAARRWLVNAYAEDSFERMPLGEESVTDADVAEAVAFYLGPLMNPWPETLAVIEAVTR